MDCVYCYYRHKETVLKKDGAGAHNGQQHAALETHGGARCGARPTLLSGTETKGEFVPGLPTGRISDELLEEFTEKYIADQDVDSVLFNWHGGEPALLGLDFYRKGVTLQQKYAGTKRIENDFQTNGVLLDDSWCEFFKEQGFWVGLSIDGPKHLHDRLRRGKGNTPTFDLVYRAARLLQKHEVPFNPLTVVNSINVRYPAEVYRFLTEDLGCRRLQWLPCVQRKDFQTVAPGYWDNASLPVMGTPAARPGHPTSVVTDWSVDPDDWGEFLCQTFDLWRRDRDKNVSVNWFNSLLGQWAGRPAGICTLAGVCGRSLVTMEKDGSLYSCDHFVFPEHRLGNVSDKDRRPIDMVYSQKQRTFGTNKHSGLPDYCLRCADNFACNGECPKNRFIKAPDGQPGLNYLCSGNKRFLTYADPHLRQMVATLPSSGTTQVII
jgi:uncharacterized protein